MPTRLPCSRISSSSRPRSSVVRRSSRGSRALDPGGGLAALTLAQLADAIRDRLGEGRAHRVDVTARDPDVVLQQPHDQLTDSLVALIKNALEATRPGERVIVELGADGASACITIQDRGEGIAGEVLARVGTPFFTTKGAGLGLGLGVFLARAFVESRGGELALESTPGLGTRATVHLPLGQAT